MNVRSPAIRCSTTLLSFRNGGYIRTKDYMKVFRWIVQVPTKDASGTVPLEATGELPFWCTVEWASCRNGRPVSLQDPLVRTAAWLLGMHVGA